MAINLFNKYGGRANPPSIDYPQGSVKNRSAPDVKDGTPLDADWANDHQGFFQSILSYFGVTANGTPDKVGASQYFDALMSDPSESKRGMPLAATNAEVAAGTNNGKMVTPAGLKSHLGTAATRNVGTASGDVMAVGAGGWLGDAQFFCANIDDRTQRGWWYVTGSTNGTKPCQLGIVLTYGYSNDAINQEFVELIGGGDTGIRRRFIRNCFHDNPWSPWCELYHTGNLQLPLGQSQTWQDVSSARELGVNYTNTTGRTIAVAITSHTVYQTKRFLYIQCDGVEIARVDFDSNSTGQVVYALIPSGSTYIANGNIADYYWSELR